MPVVLELNSNAAAILRALKVYPADMAQAIAKAMDQTNVYTVGLIQKNRLSFSKDAPPVPEGLRVVSNRLRSSVRASRSRVQGDIVSSGIGSSVVYAAVHEFGFSGTVQVKGYTRKVASRDSFVRGPRGGKGKKASSGVGFVRPHSSRRNIPARAPFTRGIIDNQDEYSRAFSAEIVRSWQEINQ